MLLSIVYRQVILFILACMNIPGATTLSKSKFWVSLMDVHYRIQQVDPFINADSYTALSRVNLPALQSIWYTEFEKIDKIESGGQKT